MNELRYPVWAEDFLYIMETNNIKQFKTIDEQIDLLASRRMSFNNVENAKKLLLTNNYYNVINGYKDLFMNNEDTFKNGTSFEELYALYDFDRSLRDILLKYILKIENTLRTLVAYYFSLEHGNDNYLTINNFNCYQNINVSEKTKIKRIKYIQELIIKIQQKTSKAMISKSYIQHYVVTYGFVPLWVLVNILSFGELSKFIELMKQKERVKIAKFFDCDEDGLIQMVKLINFYRNLCAHDERVYNAKLPKYLYIKDTKYHQKLDIPKNNDMYKYGKNDFFALIISFKILLNDDDFYTMFNKVFGRTKSLEKKLNTIDIDDILKIMNLPYNWWQIKKS